MSRVVLVFFAAIVILRQVFDESGEPLYARASEKGDRIYRYFVASGHSSSRNWRKL